jgi:hypothetical protein
MFRFRAACGIGNVSPERLDVAERRDFSIAELALPLSASKRPCMSNVDGNRMATPAERLLDYPRYGS